MKIVLATNNADKVKEMKEFYKEYEILALSEICEPFEIAENGASFKENALIKARAVFGRLENLGEDFIALSDDSGINVAALNGAPGIFSARFSGVGASDAKNRAKMIEALHAKNLRQSAAFYTACIGIASKFGEFSAHGFLHGRVIDEERGKNGFGYDFIFIPNGFNRTIGELDINTKLKISHRSKGLELAKIILKFLDKTIKREQK